MTSKRVFTTSEIAAPSLWGQTNIEHNSPLWKLHNNEALVAVVQKRASNARSTAKVYGMGLYRSKGATGGFSAARQPVFDSGPEAALGVPANLDPEYK